MPINKFTNVDEDLQESLAAYGLLRNKIMDEAPPSKTGEPNFFGIKHLGGYDVELKFDSTIENIQDNQMTLALAAPELETFNMLVTTNFQEAVKVATKDEIRTYLRRIVDRA